MNELTHDDFESLAALDAIGAATPEEERALRTHLESCRDCSAARDAMIDAAALIALDLEPVTPPTHVREHIMRAVAEDGDDESGGITPAATTPTLSRWWLSAAATFFLALWGWRELGMRAAREQVRSQDAEIARLEASNELLLHEKEKLSGELAAVGAPSTRTIALAGQQVAPAAAAKVFLEPERRRAVVFFSNMPANPGDKSYQLWIIPAGQKPQSAGTFDVTDGSATITVENLPVATEIRSLAVTLEPRGGVQQPTNTTFFVAGNV